MLLLSVRSGKAYIYAAQGCWACSALYSLPMSGSSHHESLLHQGILMKTSGLEHWQHMIRDSDSCATLLWGLLHGKWRLCIITPLSPRPVYTMGFIIEGPARGPHLCLRCSCDPFGMLSSVHAAARQRWGCAKEWQGCAVLIPSHTHTGMPDLSDSPLVSSSHDVLHKQ